MFGEDSSWVWSMLQFFGLVVSLGFIYYQLKAQVTGNMMQSLVSMADRWDSDHMMAFRRAAASSYLRDDIDLAGVDGEALAFFEDIGLYYRKRVFTLDVIWERYSYYIEHYWAMYRLHIGRLRERTSDISWFSNFERLHREIVIFGKRAYRLDPTTTPEDVARFAASELRTCAIHRGLSRPSEAAHLGSTDDAV
jgi:hypothetical protein